MSVNTLWTFILITDRNSTIVKNSIKVTYKPDFRFFVLKLYDQQLVFIPCDRSAILTKKVCSLFRKRTSQNRVVSRRVGYHRDGRQCAVPVQSGGWITSTDHSVVQVSTAGVALRGDYQNLRRETSKSTVEKQRSPEPPLM